MQGSHSSHLAPSIVAAGSVALASLELSIGCNECCCLACKVHCRRSIIPPFVRPVSLLPTESSDARGIYYFTRKLHSRHKIILPSMIAARSVSRGSAEFSVGINIILHAKSVLVGK